MNSNGTLASIFRRAGVPHGNATGASIEQRTGSAYSPMEKMFPMTQGWTPQNETLPAAQNPLRRLRRRRVIPAA